MRICSKIILSTSFFVHSSILYLIYNVSNGFELIFKNMLLAACIFTKMTKSYKKCEVIVCREENICF